MKTLIETIVTPLVDYPEHIRITEQKGQQRLTYQLSVHESDVGKVIGKNGRNAKAIRTLMRAAESDHHKRIYLEIL